MATTKQWRPEIRRRRKLRPPAIADMQHRWLEDQTKAWRTMADGAARHLGRPVLVLLADAVIVGNPF